MNPRTVCFCHAILSMISASVAPFFRWSMATTWAVLLPSRGAVASDVLAPFLALAAAFAGLAFLAALGLDGAPAGWLGAAVASGCGAGDSLGSAATCTSAAGD